jgi:glutamine synthetase
MSVVEYVWLDTDCVLRSKTRVFTKPIQKLEDISDWSYNGSSTGQVEIRSSEIFIKPKSLFRDPFRPQPMRALIALCDTYKPDGTPLDDNKRIWAEELFKKKIKEEPQFGIEQEYFLIDKETGEPLGFRVSNEPQTKGKFYCSIGSDNAFGREVAEGHLEACLQSGVRISGANSEASPGQWQYQIGPCEGIDAGDHLLISRYLLLKVAEMHNHVVSFDPKPLKGDWNGSGCHTNFSTKKMREGTENKTGLDIIGDSIEKLSKNHNEHMSLYGEGNKERMTGKNNTSNYEKFSSGIGDRSVSIRIGTETFNNRKGYLEDRRPSANMNPYLVTGMIFKTICLDE